MKTMNSGEIVVRARNNKRAARRIRKRKTKNITVSKNQVNTKQYIAKFSTHVQLLSQSAFSFADIILSISIDIKVKCAMELFLSICETYNVSATTSSEWMENIRRQYSGEKRYFHNVQMLEKKFDLIMELAQDESFKNALILATLFQYYHYDVKRDLKNENCDEFKLFVDQSGIKDVSEPVFLDLSSS